MDGWGKVAIGTRLEKQVEPGFFRAWSLLITQGLRPGDAWMVEDGKVAHKAANDLARRFLQSDCDSLLMLDSDAEFGPGVLAEMRDYELGWPFDALQAFYCRRGWPPEAIWFKRNSLGNLYQCLVYGDDVIQDVALVGTHCVLIRRRLLEGVRNAQPTVDPKRFEWFHYPRHEEMSEDAAFSVDATRAGFRLGATTHVKVGHIGSVTTGWETYQEVLELSGQNERLRWYKKAVGMVAEFTHEPVEMVEAKAMRRAQNVRDALVGRSLTTADEVRAFYGAVDNGYLYDLLAWNATPLYQAILEPLWEVANVKALIVGGGLGTEAEVLCKRNMVDVFDLPGVLWKFCAQRPDRRWNMLDGRYLSDSLNSKRYDLVVMIDVLEHIHPAEFEDTLDTAWKSTALGGRWYLHNSFGHQDKYPIHFDHADQFEAWIQRTGARVQAGANGTVWMTKS